MSTAPAHDMTRAGYSEPLTGYEEPRAPQSMSEGERRAREELSAIRDVALSLAHRLTQLLNR